MSEQKRKILDLPAANIALRAAMDTVISSSSSYWEKGIAMEDFYVLSKLMDYQLAEMTNIIKKLGDTVEDLTKIKASQDITILSLEEELEEVCDKFEQLSAASLKHRQDANEAQNKARRLEADNKRYEGCHRGITEVIEDLIAENESLKKQVSALTAEPCFRSWKLLKRN